MEHKKHGHGQHKDRSKLSVKKNHDSKDQEDRLTEISSKIDETDEMKLKMLAAFEKPEPEDMLYPPELNEHLIAQLRVSV